MEKISDKKDIIISELKQEIQLQKQETEDKISDMQDRLDRVKRHCQKRIQEMQDSVNDEVI